MQYFSNITTFNSSKDYTKKEYGLLACAWTAFWRVY